MLILGTDTDVGKTSISALLLAGLGDRLAYWKPVETGTSDSRRLKELVPAATIFDPVLSLPDPVAPPLAARNAGVTVPWSRDLAARKPASERTLLIETFGSPFSPLNERELQLAFILELGGPTLLVSSSTLGAIGRTLGCLQALAGHGVKPVAIVLLGPDDPFAVEKLRQHGESIPVFALPALSQWNADEVTTLAAQHRATLEAIARACVATANQSAAPTLLGDRWHVWHPYTPVEPKEEPLVVVGADAEFLHLADGRRVIDGISSWWTIHHGHRHPVLMEALRQASRRFDHVQFAGLTHEPGVRLAELLLHTMPWYQVGPDAGRVFYSDDGSTAVEVALKMAFQFWQHQGEPGRRRFLGFENAYHGDTFGAMAVSRDPLFFGTFEPLLCQTDIVPLDPERLDAHLQKHAHETAAVIVEPLVQGAGGMRMHSPATLRQIYDITKRHGVLFIADEVMTGGGRTGTLWAFQAAGIVPDLVCTGKTLAGGVLPIAATLVAPHIVNAFRNDDRRRTFFHGHSFTAHPLACALGVANFQWLVPHIAPRVHVLEEHWKRLLGDLAGAPGVRDVRIRGSIAAIEVDASGGYLADVGRAMRLKCLEHDVLLRPLGNVLYALPPLAISEASIERIAAAMRAAIVHVTS